jgi:hypothetical protein
MGDPLVMLACKGIMKDKKNDIKALVSTIRSIIPPGSNYSIKKPGADQLTAICMLLEDLHSAPCGDDAPVTKKAIG